MKVQQLLVRALFGCVLVGASGAAMAGPELPSDSSCPLGVILNEAVNNLTVQGQDCLVQDAIIVGNVKVSNRPGEVFVLRDSIVNGRVRITGGAVSITGTEVITSNLVVKDTTEAVVRNTLVRVGNMRFEGNDYVLLISNTVGDGNIRCVKNILELAVENIIPNGVETCFGQ